MEVYTKSQETEQEESKEKKLDPENPIDVRNLIKAMQSSYKKLKRFREDRYDFIKESVGSHYGEHGTQHHVPVNLLRLWQNIYTRSLVASNPRVLITTPVKSLRPFAATFEEAMNHTIRKMDFKKKLQTLVIDAMYGIGIAKVGLCEGNYITVEDNLYSLGEIFIDTVDLDNFVIDMCANGIEEAQFIGDIETMDWEVAQEVYKDSAGAKNLKKFENNDFGKNNGEDSKRLSKLSKGNNKLEEFKKTTKVVEIYLPKERLIVCLPWGSDSENIEPLSIRDYNGPKAGPYDLLAFNEVPSNIMPLAPAAALYDMHVMANKVYRKLSRQAERQKTLSVVGKRNKKELEKINAADDGQSIYIDETASIKEIKFGGPDNMNSAFFIQTMNLYNKLAGNIDSLGGLSPQSGTLGQDKLLSGSASKTLEDMQEKVEDCTRSICEKVGWYLFYDPFIELPLTKRIPGIDIDIPASFSSDEIEGNYLDYNFSIKPYSLQEDTPLSKFNNVVAILQNIITPMMPVMQQQGVNFDMQQLIAIISKLKNLSELSDILTVTDPITGSVDGIGDKKPVGSGPAKTQREYIRTNISGTSDKGKDAAMMQALTGMGNGQAKPQAVFE